MSTHEPVLENDEMASLSVEDATVTAAAAEAGDLVQASVESLPAATAMGTPESTSACTAASAESL